MRIMQVNSYVPIRQNRMAFQGEETNPAEKPLLEQLTELDDRINRGGVERPEAEATCRKIFDDTSLKLVTGTGTPDDAKAFTKSGEILAHIILSDLRHGMEHPQRTAILDKVGHISKTFDGVILGAHQTTGSTLGMRNTILRIMRPYLSF